MKFKKQKVPKAEIITDTLKVFIAQDDTALLQIFGQPFGPMSAPLAPRSAIKLARWLERYAKYQSLEKSK